MGLGSDAEKLELLGEAAELLQGLPARAFPCREAAWLLTTAWNRGCHHAKFGRPAEARAMMAAALALLPACPELQPRQEVGNSLQSASNYAICNLHALLVAMPCNRSAHGTERPIMQRL